MRDNNNKIHVKCQNTVRQISVLEVRKGPGPVKKGPRKQLRSELNLRRKKTQTSRKERTDLHGDR